MKTASLKLIVQMLFCPYIAVYASYSPAMRVPLTRSSDTLAEEHKLSAITEWIMFYLKWMGNGIMWRSLGMSKTTGDVMRVSLSNWSMFVVMKQNQNWNTYSQVTTRSMVLASWVLSYNRNLRENEKKCPAYNQITYKCQLLWGTNQNGRHTSSCCWVVLRSSSSISR